MVIIRAVSPSLTPADKQLECTQESVGMAHCTTKQGQLLMRSDLLTRSFLWMSGSGNQYGDQRQVGNQRMNVFTHMCTRVVCHLEIPFITRA